MSVLLVAAKRDLVEAKRHLLEEAGFPPSVIDVDAFALHNAFEANHPDAMHGTVALLNIGNEQTNLNILDEGVPILTRDLGVGTRRFREDVQREHGISGEEAEDMLRGFDRSPLLDGTIGMRGAYKAMREGYVDETWAKEHHELWYNDIKAGKIPTQRSNAGPAPAAPASTASV